ncbi:hypothetical protein N7467_007159 [Penicillium canescens]|nr:hypothetical protein N7467_007159 [Penicillium canescens]
MRPSMLGQSIALKVNTESCGTLGGFFEVKMRGSSAWRTMAMTCFHVVDPKDGQLGAVIDTMLQQWRREGIRPDHPQRGSLEVHHPAPDTMNQNFETLRLGIDKIDCNNHFQTLARQVREGTGDMMSRDDKNLCRALMPEYDALNRSLQMAESFVFNTGPHFGVVWAASGDRTGILSEGGKTVEYKLDWALIEVPSHRVSPNQTPEGQPFHTSPLPTDLNGLEVCLWGQRTGLRTRVVHRLKTANLLESLGLRANNPYADSEAAEDPTVGYIVTGTESSQFARLGDSGGLVFTNSDPARRVLIGIMFSGEEHGRYSLFTPIYWVYKGIKQLTGATDVRFRL